MTDDNGLRVLGIDTGINGGCGLYLPQSIVPTAPEGIFDIPTVGDGNQREIDYAGLRDLIWSVRPTHVFIEMINAFVPKDAEGNDVKWGGTSMLRFGGAYYGSRAVVACLGIPMQRVTAAKWKNHFGLKGGAAFKDDARQLAIERFPAVRPFMTRKLDGHRGDGFLIAVYGAAVLQGETRPMKRAPKKVRPIAAPVYDAEDIPE